MYNKAKAHAYYLKNKERIKEVHKRYLDNKECPPSEEVRKKRAIKARKYYAENREKILERQREAYRKKHPIGTQRRKYRRPDERDSICWDCAKAGGFCPWSAKDENGICQFQPVDGWEAIPTEWESEHEELIPSGSYLVLSCPLFEQEKPTKVKEAPKRNGKHIKCHLVNIITGEQHTFGTVRDAGRYVYDRENGKTSLNTIDHNLRLVKDTGCAWREFRLWTDDSEEIF